MGNVTSSVAARFAFFPPDPPTYEVYKDGEDDDGRLVFTGLTADKNVRVHLLETKGGNKIVATFWKHPFGRFTILYSHGNAADLGQMQELFIELRAHLRVNIMRYFGEYVLALFLCFSVILMVWKGDCGVFFFPFAFQCLCWVIVCGVFHSVLFMRYFFGVCWVCLCFLCLVGWFGIWVLFGLRDD